MKKDKKLIIIDKKDYRFFRPIETSNLDSLVYVIGWGSGGWVLHSDENWRSR